MIPGITYAFKDIWATSACVRLSSSAIGLLVKSIGDSTWTGDDGCSGTCPFTCPPLFPILVENRFSGVVIPSLIHPLGSTRFGGASILRIISVLSFLCTSSLGVDDPSSLVDSSTTGLNPFRRRRSDATRHVNLRVPVVLAVSGECCVSTLATFLRAASASMMYLNFLAKKILSSNHNFFSYRQGWRERIQTDLRI